MSLKVVFMGTPGFAVTTLKAIKNTEHKIVGVVTNIDKPAGRGKKNKHFCSKRLCPRARIKPFTAHLFKRSNFY